ncbi:MAG TPA: diacylglycerol kinase family protein [Candidatus Binatus sp.]|nr:diacylglycerol kinase family protein [Candidatus Binatus sp.]
MSRTLVIGRLRKGRPIRATVRETQRTLEAAGWPVEASVVKKKKSMRRHVAAAVRDGVEIVVAVGGDGAVLQVIQGLADSPAALGIVPLGTGNLVATNLGIPRNPDRATAIVLDGAERVFDLGRAELDGKERVFAVACGVGFDAEVMDATSIRRKRRWGRLAYAATALRKAAQVRSVEHEITIDGETLSFEASQVFVANFGRTGLGLKPRLTVSPDDGLLDLVALRGSGPIYGVLAAWEAIRQRRSGRSPGGRAFRARAGEVRIEPATRRLVEIDGSVIGRTPVTVTVKPGALRVRVPRAKG